MSHSTSTEQSAEEKSAGRYLLFLDILGFTQLVEEKGADEILRIITEVLDQFDRWEKLNRCFRTIYFSDSFIFYQESKGFGEWAFLDIYAIGGMILSALLARGIAARGAISFGEFEVSSDRSGKREVFFGQALIDAYKAEQKNNWIGITILKDAWEPYDKSTGGSIKRFEGERAWLRLNDDLLLNSFHKLIAWYDSDQLGEIDRPYSEWDPPEFPDAIAGFRFIHERSQAFIAQNDFTGKVASKYHATVLFLKAVFGEEKYHWACKLAGISA